MDKSSSLFTGICGAFLLSTTCMVLIPHHQLSGLQPVVGDWDGTTPSPASSYPVKMENELGHRPGQRLFMEHGCFYCHSQQVRDPQYGPDIARGWGPRRTVARDYIYENVPLLGSTRLGPDFANYGWRGEAKDAKGNDLLNAAGQPVIEGKWRNEPAGDPKRPVVRDESWVYKHMYAPRTYVHDSNCPPMPHLFELKDIGAAPSADAVAVVGDRQLVPTPDARYIARYLLSLSRTPELPEASNKNKPKEAKK